MAKPTPHHKTRMTTWCVLTLLGVGLFLLAGYVLFESPGHGPAQPAGGTPAATDR